MYVVVNLLLLALIAQTHFRLVLKSRGESCVCVDSLHNVARMNSLLRRSKEFMGPKGLEPLTFAMSTQRSNQLSYEPVY